MTISPRLMTAEDLLHLPDDGQRRELIAGEVRTMAPGGGDHGLLTMNLSTPLDVHVRAHRLGRVFTAETGFLLASDPDTVRAADVAFMRQERIPAARRAGYWAGAPDLAVEFVSPHDLFTEVEEKVATWLRYDARMVIVVNPRRRTASIYRPPWSVQLLTEADTLDGGEVVPGWTLPVAALFEL
jgi:Uma2 family endonuclease